jgi:ribosome-associated translation inhibitor RaiA
MSLIHVEAASMLLPIQITWRGMEPSAALEGRVRALAQQLEKFSSKMIHCHVIIELPHKRGHQGHIYEVHIQVTVPGTELIAQYEHRELQSHEDPYVAVRDAFRAVRRQLQDYARKRRLDVKGHTLHPTLSGIERRSAEAGTEPLPRASITRDPRDAS